jgi:hypothetical protein
LGFPSAGMKTANHQNANLTKSVKTSLNQQQSSATATSTTSFLGGILQPQQQNNVPQFGHHTTGSNLNNLIGNINNLSPQQQQPPPPFVHPRIQPNPQQQISHSSGAISLSHIKDWRNVPHAKAVYDFSSRESGDLSFKRGDLIILKKRIDHNWSIGECNGKFRFT